MDPLFQTARKRKMQKVQSKHFLLTHLLLLQKIIYKHYKVQLNPLKIKLDYSQIKSIREKFFDDSLLQATVTNFELSQLYPWLQNIKPNLSQYDKNAMLKQCEKFATNQEDFLKLSFLKRLFKKEK